MKYTLLIATMTLALTACDQLEIQRTNAPPVLGTCENTETGESFTYDDNKTSLRDGDLIYYELDGTERVVDVRDYDWRCKATSGA